jgi:translation initiation factor IF-2
MSQLEARAPVVTVMGHVDHGKTSLLDALRDTHVADREAGGITQAIGASQIEYNGRRIVFVDTPGHEAFTRMRAQGAKVTDVVILVVAADDGVMPQTLEAMDHARAAKVPIVVAVNKIDKANAQPDRVKQQLSDRGLMPEEWGGDTVFVNVSALQRTNLEQLLEMVLLTADLRELKANPNRAAVGTVLESKLDRGQGPVATVIVQNGTLRVGDYFVVGSVFGRVRALIDHQGQKLPEAGPSTAVVVLGLEDLPQPGDQLTVVTDTERAKKIVEHREQKEREQQMAQSSRLSLEQFQDKLRRGEVKELPIVLKADVQGSLDVLEDMLRKLKTDKVAVQIVRTGVGAISESDVLLAITAGAIIVGFNVRPERSASVLAEREKVEIRLHTVIYELSDELKKALAGLLAPVIKEEFQGRAAVKEVFHVSKVGTVAGCLLEEGKATSTSKARLLRDNIVVYTGKISSLRRFKDDVSEVRAGQECGITLHNYNDVKQGDVIEIFQTVEVAQELNL